MFVVNLRILISSSRLCSVCSWKKDKCIGRARFRAINPDPEEPLLGVFSGLLIQRPRRVGHCLEPKAWHLARPGTNVVPDLERTQSQFRGLLTTRALHFHHLVCQRVAYPPRWYSVIGDSARRDCRVKCSCSPTVWVKCATSDIADRETTRALPSRRACSF